MSLKTELSEYRVIASDQKTVYTALFYAGGNESPQMKEKISHISRLFFEKSKDLCGKKALEHYTRNHDRMSRRAMRAVTAEVDVQTENSEGKEKARMSFCIRQGRRIVKCFELVMVLDLKRKVFLPVEE